jgi:hypothetical protein
VGALGHNRDEAAAEFVPTVRAAFQAGAGARLKRWGCVSVPAGTPQPTHTACVALKNLPMRLFALNRHLSCDDSRDHVRTMFVVDGPTAAAIRKAYLESGELSAVVELRRHFPGIVNNENARLCVRTIANWQPLPPLSPPSLPQGSHGHAGPDH